jgi:hypothetical protein
MSLVFINPAITIAANAVSANISAASICFHLLFALIGYSTFETNHWQPASRLGQKTKPEKSGGPVPAYNSLGRRTDLACIFRLPVKKRRGSVRPLGIMHWLVAIPVITARRKKAYAPLIKSPPKGKLAGFIELAGYVQTFFL